MGSPLIAPLSSAEAPASTQEIYARIAETIGSGTVPAAFQQMGHVEPFLQDSYMNYRKFVHDGTGKLDAQQRQAIALAASSVMNSARGLRFHAQAAKQAGWSDSQVTEILAVTSTCTMYNTYYKFKDLAEDEQLAAASIGLRAHTWQKTSLTPPLVELLNIVASNLNGCKKCTSGHVQKGLQLGLTREQIDEAIRISAIITAFNSFLGLA